MADQNTILKLVAKRTMSVVDLVKAVPRGKLSAKAHRKSVLQAASGLVERKLAKPYVGVHGRDYDDAAWAITDEGRAFIRGGKVITSGQSNLNVPRHPTEASLRERLWRALRIKGRGTVPQLVAMVRKEGDADDLSRNAQTYLQRLTWAGVVLVLKTRKAGMAPSSPGHKVFMLARDLGPAAPVVHRDFLFDPNPELPGYRRIPYSERPKS